MRKAFKGQTEIDFVTSKTLNIYSSNKLTFNSLAKLNQTVHTLIKLYYLKLTFLHKYLLWYIIINKKVIDDKWLCLLLSIFTTLLLRMNFMYFACLTWKR